MPQIKEPSTLCDLELPDVTDIDIPEITDIDIPDFGELETEMQKNAQEMLADPDILRMLRECEEELNDLK